MMQMRITRNSIVYCDANFLVALSAGSVKQPELKKRACILFAKLLISGCKTIASPLTFDEMWLGIRREIGAKNILNNLRFGVNKFLNNKQVEYYSYTEIFPYLQDFTDELLKHRNLSIIQFNDAQKGVKNSLQNIKNFKLKPRDAFHLSYVNDNGATHFITNDGHFNGKGMDIEV